MVGNFVETEVNKDTVNYTFDVIEKHIPEGETVDLSELVIKVDDIDVTDKITKVITPEKMDLEEAIMRMELLNHSFFIYTDEETDEIAVVYKRNNGGYGCIETSNE